MKTAITKQDIFDRRKSLSIGEDESVIYPLMGSPFSVARFYGGCQINGRRFVVVEDVLVREDVVKEVKKLMAKERKAKGK